MAKDRDDALWKRLKAGRLDEREHDELSLTSRGSPRGFVRLPSLGWADGRLAVVVTDRPYLHGQIRGFKLGEFPGLKTAPFHFRHSRITKVGTFGIPPSVLRGERVIVWPEKREVRDVEKHGATRDWRNCVRTMAVDNPFLKTARGAAMATTLAGARKLQRRLAKSAVLTAAGARNFQKYIERGTRDEGRLREEVEHDIRGAISLGNLGPTADARVGFWREVEARERRQDAVLQSRIIAELPHWICPADRREIVTRFVQFFESKGLGVWATVHLPNTKRGSDSRNIHLHLVYHDRPVETWDPAGVKPPVFADRKNPDFSDREWPQILRETYADIVNEVVHIAARRDKRPPVRLFHPGSNRSLGILVPPQIHLGPKPTALRRAGRLKHVEIAKFRALERTLDRLGSDANADIERSKSRLGSLSADFAAATGIVEAISDLIVENAVHRFLAVRREAQERSHHADLWIEAWDQTHQADIKHRRRATHELLEHARALSNTLDSLDEALAKLHERIETLEHERARALRETSQLVAPTREPNPEKGDVFNERFAAAGPDDFPNSIEALVTYCREQHHLDPVSIEAVRLLLLAARSCVLHTGGSREEFTTSMSRAEVDALHLVADAVLEGMTRVASGQEFSDVTRSTIGYVDTTLASATFKTRLPPATLLELERDPPEHRRRRRRLDLEQ
jgi:hypothetical protein